ncbi:MAG: flagellar hook-length control protein FliK [Pseudomonadota bacterium]
MEELQLALTTSRTDQRNFGLWISNWQVGQALNALVADRLPSGDLLLKVDGRTLTARSDVAAQPGARLQLEVKQLDPLPTLRVLTSLSNGARSGTPTGTLQILSPTDGPVSTGRLQLVGSNLPAASRPDVRIVAEVIGQRPSGELQLRVADQQLSARADSPLNAGTRLVLQGGESRTALSFRILDGATLSSRPDSTASAGSANVRLATGTVQTLQLGQIVNARVEKRVGSGEFLLQTAGERFTVNSQATLQPGSRVLLEVRQTQPVPAFQFLGPVSSGESSKLGGTLKLLTAAPSINAPGVASVPLGASVQAAQTIVRTAAVPAPVLDAVGQLLRAVPRADRLTNTEGLSSALRDSGNYLEGRLSVVDREAGATNPVRSDLKGGLFRALAQVNGALAEAESTSFNGLNIDILLDLKREFEAGLARVTVNQLASQVPQDAQAPRQWQMDVPVQLGTQIHTLGVRIERDGAQSDSNKQQGEDEKRRWTVDLKFSPPALGAIEARLRIQNDEVEVRLQAERRAVHKILNENLHLLGSALKSRGLHLSKATSVPLVPTKVTATRSGVDIRA